MDKLIYVPHRHPGDSGVIWTRAGPCECYGVGLVVLFNLRGNVHQALITLLIREAILCHGVVFDVV